MKRTIHDHIVRDKPTSTPRTKGDPEKLRALLEESQLLQSLWQDEMFQVWWARVVADAEQRCVRAVANHLSHYDKAMVAGIISHVRALEAEFRHKGSQDYRQKVEKALKEAEYGGGNEDGGRRRGKFPIEGIGQF